MKIVLGVTGGIAAYKAVLLARLLIEAGHELHVVPTEDALKFVGRPTWEAISHNSVTASVHDDVPEVRHVALGQGADLIIVAPATANTIAKMAAGIADDLLGTTLLATRAPVMIAPAMHTEMWEHPSTQHNIKMLRDRGVQIVGPESGRLTGTDSGPGRMTEPDVIARIALHHLTPKIQDLAGLSVLVTAGGTREAIDPVRYIGNRSSGRQGVAIAEAAADRGARVELVVANISADLLDEVHARAMIRVNTVGSASELKQRTGKFAPSSDMIFMVAAVSDYRVAKVSDVKIRKEDTQKEAEGTRSLTLIENPDILRGLVLSREAGDAQVGQTIVGFAAETGDSVSDIIERGLAKRRRKGTDFLAINQVGWAEGFETLDNTIHVVNAADEVVVTSSGTKREVADALISAVVGARD